MTLHTDAAQAPAYRDHARGSSRARGRGVGELAWAFLRLGCTSFGGPVAHLAYLRAEFVDKRKWLDDAEYADLVALCQFLPGPASSQVVFALGAQRAGLVGALLATALFTLPSVLLMLGFAYGIARVPSVDAAGWLHGLKLAAVPVVAQAVWSMGKKLCPDCARMTLCLAAAAAAWIAPGAIGQLSVIVLGACVGLALYSQSAAASARLPQASPDGFGSRGNVVAASALVTFVVLLVALPALAAATGSRAVAVFDSFYRSGSLVFGGGHVVLPLLRAEVVDRGWVSDAQFLAGYGAAQAVPGPLFTFAAYLGAAMHPTQAFAAVRSGLLSVFAIFLPAFLLIAGMLPFWHQLRQHAWAVAALAGTNAAVVGVLLAALYNPVFVESVRGPRDAALALCAFGLLDHWKLPAWGVVLSLAVVGHLATFI